MFQDNHNVIVKITKNVSLLEVIDLYKKSGWWNDNEQLTNESIKSIINNSFCFAGAFFNNKLIGMGRAISDGVSDAYIQDVTVINQFQKQGLGHKIVKTILDFLLKCNIKWIGLVAVPFTEDFYKKLGFDILKNHTPMLYKL